MSTLVSTLRSSISIGRALAWQNAWAQSQLGYEPSDEELALLEDARRRPDYYTETGRPPSRRPTSRTRRASKPYRMPTTIT
jgi:hypothetical protein